MLLSNPLRDAMYLLLIILGFFRAPGFAAQSAPSTCENCVEGEEPFRVGQVELLQRAQTLLANRRLLNVTLPSGQESRGPDDVFYHVHIPKVAGISFSYDALEMLTTRGLRLISREGCFARPGLPDPRPRDRLVMIRNPAAHVLSQYNYCRYGSARSDYIREVTAPSEAPMPNQFQDWVRAWTQLRSQGWSGNYTPTADRVHRSGRFEVGTRMFRMHAWSEPPWALPGNGMLQEADWPELDGGGTIWHHVKVPFHTYVPINFQSQRMACTQAMVFPEKVNMSVALQNLDRAFHVGVVEAYQSSLCILHAKIDGKLPPFCDCGDADKWHAFTGNHDNSGDESETTDATKVASVGDLPQEVRDLVDGLTDQDIQLYDRAWARLVREARWVEAEHGVKVLCDETQPPRYPAAN